MHLTVLLTFTSCYYRYISRSATNIKYNRSLNPWNKEMGSFASDVRFHTLKSIKYYSSVASFNCNIKKIITIIKKANFLTSASTLYYTKTIRYRTGRVLELSPQETALA